MNVAVEAIDNAKIVQIVGSLRDLAVIRNRECAASIWQRSLMPQFETWIQGLALNQLPVARELVKTSELRDRILQICLDCGLPNSPEQHYFIDDVVELAENFADIMAAQYLRLRFDVVTTNSCRKFHIDSVKARLICTYRGTGTQYGISIGGDDPQDISTVPTGSPMMIRGTQWSETPESGLLHRSPPIEERGETRLLLVIDPIENLEEEI